MTAEDGADASADDLAYCADSVRAADSDRFATLALAPADRRAALLALYAFNVEVARSRELVSQQLVGSIRLQWWRDTIEGIYAGSPRRHQVVQPLAAAVRAHGLDRADFDTLLEAREADMADDPPATLAAMTAYARDTAGSLVRLALQATGSRDPAALDAGSAAGTAWGLIGLMRAVPFHAAQGRLMLPADLLSEAGIPPEPTAPARHVAALAGPMRRIGEAAAAELAAARAGRRAVPRRALSAMLCATLAAGYLRQLGRAGWNPFDGRVAMPLPSRAWRLLGAAVTGRY